MSSLYDRLNLTKPLKLREVLPKTSMWERLSLERPVKPKCSDCRSLIELNWHICPYCGARLTKPKIAPQHCIWIDASGVCLNDQNRNTMLEMLRDSFSKVHEIGPTLGLDH